MSSIILKSRWIRFLGPSKEGKDQGSVRLGGAEIMFPTYSYNLEEEL